MSEASAPGTEAAAPDWFVRALARPAHSNSIPFEGAALHYRSWNAGDTGKPGLLFVHGYRGHSHWWDFIAPFFTDRFRVAAMDFSGMGDSGHRPAYSLGQHGAEIAAVIDHARLAPATVVAHSYGGSRLLRCCADAGEGIAHAVVVDAYVTFPDLALPRIPDQPHRRPPYPDYAAARSRFRLVPDQYAEPYLLEHVARHSLKAVEGRWTWKFDPALPPGTPEADGPGLLGRIAAPVSYICGERSVVVDAGRARRVGAALRQGRGPVVIPQAGHHIMLDQPLALIAALQALLA